MASPKTPSKAASEPGKDGAPQPSLQEAFFFLSILKNQQNKPEVDWSKVAEESGFKNAETAKVRFGQIKRKLGFGTPQAARVTPRKRQAGAGASPVSAEKKVRKPTPKKGKAKARVKPEDEQDDPTNITVTVKDEKREEGGYDDAIVAPPAFGDMSAGQGAATASRFYSSAMETALAGGRDPNADTRMSFDFTLNEEV